MNGLGALLVSAAGAFMGLAAARELGKTVRLREELCWLLERLFGELEAFCSPLPELFGTLERVCTGDRAVFLCRRVADGLERGDSFESLWVSALGEVPARERQILLRLGPVLGRYGAEAQLPAISLCRREMEQALREARDRRRDLGRVYIGLGTAGGLMLAVLLV